MRTQAGITGMNTARQLRTARPRRIWAAPLCALVLLTACTPKEFPENPLLAPANDLKMPVLLPLDPLLAQIAPAVDAANPDPELAQRGADLRSRAQTASVPTAEQSQDNADWTAQAEALRAKADAARNSTE